MAIMAAMIGLAARKAVTLLTMSMAAWKLWKALTPLSIMVITVGTTERANCITVWFTLFCMIWALSAASWYSFLGEGKVFSCFLGFLAFRAVFGYSLVVFPLGFL